MGLGLAALVEGIDSLVAAGPGGLGEGEQVAELHRQLARLDAVVTQATAVFDAAKGWEPDGARNASCWLVSRCRVPKRVARRRVSVGRKLRLLAVCEEAWLAGDITGDHVATIGAVRRSETAELLARDEKVLVDAARTQRFDCFARAVAYWDQLADPDGAEDAERDRSSRRDAYLDESFGGMWLGKMIFDPVSGTIVGGEVARLEKELFEADWADAKRRLGREPTIGDLARTPGQRRADAFVEMAIRSRTAPVGGIRPAPLFSVLVGYETVHGRVCQLAGGTVIAPGALVPWLDQGYIERAVFGLGNRVEVSASARLFGGATRRAIELRDRECAHPYCDVTAADCQVDHIVPYVAGGPTTQDNGELLCGFHNRLKEKRPPPPPGAQPGQGQAGRGDGGAIGPAG